MNTFTKDLLELKVISYGDSFTNFKSIAIWPDQTQQITIETIKGFDGKGVPEKKTF